MNTEVERLFEAARRIPPEKRVDFLSRECADQAVRCEVELLLGHDEGAETFLQNAVSSAAASVVQSLSMPSGSGIGPYRILSQVGRGGMGVVYLAERADGLFEQRVAIKVVQAGHEIPMADQRLQQEYRILATLEHPNIARLHDAGMTDTGLPYFVMEYVQGKPIDRFCQERQLSLRERLRLFLPVCEAVHFAHQKLIVHRDVKPDNILVTGEGVPKLLDFGVSKVLTESPTDVQNTGTRALTPEYASPEQVRGERVGTATDVYALGGVLYKLLTGMAPHQVKGKSPLEVMRVICEEEPRRPSEICSELSGDLDYILQMAMRQEVERRYHSVEQFATDIHHSLEGRPVLAGPDTHWYRSKKFVERHWLGVTAIVAVILALGVGVAISTWEARRAERRFAEVRHLANVFLFDFENSIHDVPGTIPARQLLVKTALEYLQSLSREASGDRALMHELAVAYEKVGDIQGYEGSSNVGSTAESIRSYEQALAMRRSIGEPESKFPKTRLDFSRLLIKVAIVRHRTAELDAAVRNCSEAISLIEPLVRANPSDRSTAHSLADAEFHMASFLQRRNDTSEALAHGRRGLALEETLAASAPQDHDAQAGLSHAYWRIGDLFEGMSNLSEAITDYKKALDIDDRLLAEKRTDRGMRRSVMIALAKLGTVEVEATSKPSPQAEEAVAHLRRAFAISQDEVKEDPANAEAVTDLMATGARLGDALGQNGQDREAIKVLRQAVDAARNLVQHEPSLENRVDLAATYTSLAFAVAHGGDISEAIRIRRTAASIFDSLTLESPDDPKIAVPQVWNCWRLGDLLAKQRDWQGARRTYAVGLKVAERLAPKNPSFTDILANLRHSDAHAAEMLTPHH